MLFGFLSERAFGFAGIPSQEEILAFPRNDVESVHELTVNPMGASQLNLFAERNGESGA